MNRVSLTLTLAKAAYNGVGISQYEAVCEMSNEAIRKTTHEALCAMMPCANLLMCASCALFLE